MNKPNGTQQRAITVGLLLSITKIGLKSHSTANLVTSRSTKRAQVRTAIIPSSTKYIGKTRRSTAKHAETPGKIDPGLVTLKLTKEMSDIIRGMTVKETPA